MDRENPYEIAKAIVALNVWRKIDSHQWAVVPRGAEAPFICVVDGKGDGKDIVGRLLVFPGFDVFRDFAISQRFPDYGVGSGPLDFMHTALLAAKDGRFEMFSYMPGYIPMPVKDDEVDRSLAAVLYECYGLMMRFEEDPSLVMKYASERALFARRQDGSGTWQDAKFTLPPDQGVARAERVALRNDDLAAAKKLPIEKGEAWDVDFMALPSWRTREKRPRILYIFAAVAEESRERIAWDRMSVGDISADDNDPHTILSGPAAGLQRLWESHAQRLLRAMLRAGRVPGTVNVRSSRVMRFLRPLAMQIPFKMVQHAKLDALDGVMEETIKSGRV